MSLADHTLRPLASGLVAGIGLSLARAPLGVDLASTPAVGAAEALTWRGAALAVVAFGLGRWGGERTRLVPLSWGAAAGFAFHGLLLGDALRPGSRLELYLLLALLGIAASLLRSRERAASGNEERDPPAGSLERVGLLVAGAGVALALESVARPLRLLGGGTPADDAAMASSFLVLLAFGAAAFGGLVPARLRGPAGGMLLALAALAGLESLSALQTFSSREGLEAFLRGGPWRLDPSDVGRLSGDLLLGARVLVLPAFVLGAALVVVARGSRLGWTLFGSALGLLALPSLLASRVIEEPALAAASRLALGTGLAASGGLLAALGARGARQPTRLVAAAACLGVAVAVTLAPRSRALPLSPWELFKVAPELVLETPEGLLTIEPTFDLGRVVTLDRRRLTPSTSSEPADELRLQLSWSRVAPAALEQAERRVLLVGQLTPGRARSLLALGATHIDRTAAWHRSMALLEERLFDGAELPPGRILAPAALASGGPWVLVVAPPVDGAAPLTRPAEERLDPQVVWLFGRAWCAEDDWGKHVLLASNGMEDVAVAPWQPAGFPGGAPLRGPAPWRRLGLRPFERETGAVAAALRRLADGARGTGHEQTTEGLARLAAVQERSSPFETRAQQTEVDPDGLRLLRDAALATEPDLYLRELWSSLAWLLAEKREIELVQECLAPLAERWAPWWQLELALARADLESLDPDAAAEHLLRATQERPLDLDLLLALAEALSMAGRPAQAVEPLRAVDRLQPGRRDVRRRLAMELARAGDAAAAALLEELLREDPGDDELRLYLGEGPFPTPEVRFEPRGGAHDHEDG